MNPAVVVKGYRDFVRASNQAEKESKTEVRAALRPVGEIVEDEAARLFERVDERSARGFDTRVGVRSVRVVQSLRKTTGLRGDYGSKQMREALLPAVSRKERQIEKELEKAIDKIADHFERE